MQHCCNVELMPRRGLTSVAHDAIQYQKVWFPGSGGGWRPDPLLPPPASGFDIAPNQAQGVWIEIDIKANAIAGVYNASVEIQCASNACGKLKAVPLQLSVRSHTFGRP